MNNYLSLCNRKMKKEKNKEIIAWIVISWLLPMIVTVVMTFGIVFFCLKNGLEDEIFNVVSMMYVVWAIIIAIRSMTWASKKIKEISKLEESEKNN